MEYSYTQIMWISRPDDIGSSLVKSRFVHKCKLVLDECLLKLLIFEMALRSIVGVDLCIKCKFVPDECLFETLNL